MKSRTVFDVVKDSGCLASYKDIELLLDERRKLAAVEGLLTYDQRQRLSVINSILHPELLR
jgi:hypothetical protein